MTKPAFTFKERKAFDSLCVALHDVFGDYCTTAGAHHCAGCARIVPPGIPTVALHTDYDRCPACILARGLLEVAYRELSK